MFWTDRLRSIALGAMGCLRAKARSCRVISADRPAARRTSCRYSWVMPPGGTVPIACSVYPMMTCSMLLKSWATPPAKRPIDSSFWAWANCPRSVSRSCSIRVLSARACRSSSERVSTFRNSIAFLTVRADRLASARASAMRVSEISTTSPVEPTMKAPMASPSTSIGT